MEDFQLDLIIGEGPGARSIRIDLPPFTLVGATTRSGLITRPLRERFGIPLRLLFYEPDELALIVARGARILAFDLDARRRGRDRPSRPRHAAGGDAAVAPDPRFRRRGRLALRRCRDRRRGVAAARGRRARPRRDGPALPALDRPELRGGPVGVETMAAALGEERDVIEEVIEPYLIQQGFVQRTPRGRMLTEIAFRHLEMPVPASLPGQFDLLGSLTAEAGPE